MSLEIVVATKNRKKLAEIKDILKEFKPNITSLADYPHPVRIVENGKSFRENAIKKALTVARLTGKFTLGEDSGLCVYALRGMPGIYSSRFSGKNKSDRQNNLKLLKLLDGLPLRKRKAYYVCAVALADKNDLVGVTEGRCSGVIGFQEKGTSGFGYDPLFVIPRYKKTFAQLGEKIKHKMSHRYRALKKAKKIIQKYIERQRSS
ncbi:MAG: RdgB/HAM1 family non-canonical purine NTP pyrophosphatase [Candidatus Omnitrophica bacterium]|nr:RdgB/HAM1 family non-canonical purine NTP pyrophosphatase [Candidatus Omnitrophota bacterium]